MKYSGCHIVPGSGQARLARENNAEYQEVHRKLQNKKRDYALPQSDSHRNHGTKYGTQFNQMANSIAHAVSGLIS